MTTYDRQQAITKLLNEHSSLKVSELTNRFQVSEGTIRNDLNTLEEKQVLKRVRGGAIANTSPTIYPLSNTRAQINLSEKKRIAKWAAELISDGDVVLLDASSTVLHMAPFLRERRNLTVLTNQLETAQILARDPSKTVILVGGILKSDGTSVMGSISQEVLKTLHIGTAFVSGVGFSLESGLMEADLNEAAYKEQVINSAKQVVALIDSTKFDRSGLKPFAQVDQIDHIVSDDGMSREVIRKLQHANVSLTICGENTVQSLSPHRKAKKHYKIGFANLSENVSFAVDVRRGLERAVKKYSHVDLLLADNDLNSDKAVQIADEFIDQGLDLVIEYQIDETIGNLLMNRYRDKQIPVIAIDIPMVGATFFGVDNYQSGHMAGRALGLWIKEHWEGRLDQLIILEEKRAGPLPAARIQGQLHGLQEVIGEIDSEKKLVLDSGNTTEKSYEQTAKVLKNLGEAEKIAFISFNDDAALGASQALQEFSPKQNAAIIGQGADRRIRDEIRRGNRHIIGSSSFNPEFYGERIINLALKILTGQSVAPAVYMESAFINSNNLEAFEKDPLLSLVNV